MINLILAEDHHIVRNGVKNLLKADKGLSIVGEAADGRQVLDMISSGLKADILMTDINMPEVDGMALLKELKIINPEIKVVLLSMLDNDKYISQAFADGASGYLLKTISADEMIFALKHIHSGGQYICAEIAIRLMKKLVTPITLINEKSKAKIEFTVREFEVLTLITKGLTNFQIAQKMFISKRTVEGHRSNLIAKTSSRNSAAMITFALSNGVLG